MVSVDMIQAALERFAGMPDDAVVLDSEASSILRISVWTLKRHNPVRRIDLSPRRHGRRLGDIRALVRGEKPAA
jgi:hypothetical protein